MGGGARTTVESLTPEIRDAGRDDLTAILVIERASFSDPWTRGMFSAYLVAGDGFRVAAVNGRVVGYSITRVVSDECELLNIAADPGARGAGVGSRLLDDCMRRSTLAGAREMWLEVRASNLSARALYASRGFSEMGVRKRYYESPREDAVVLRATLSTAGNEKAIQDRRGLDRAPDELILSRASHNTRQETQ